MGEFSRAGRDLTPRQEEAVWEWIEAAVARSCITRPMPISEEMPEAEIGRRVEICANIFSDLYMESRWSRQRIRDHLDSFLIKCIDGAKEWQEAKVYDASGQPAVSSIMWGKEKLREIEAERRLSALAKTKDRGTVAKPAIIIKGETPGE